MAKTPKQHEGTICRVAILTPYLFETIEDCKYWGERSGRGGEKYLKMQKEKYGFDPKNFSGIKEIEAGNGCIAVLQKPYECSNTAILDLAHSLSRDFTDLVIAGCTELQESRVQNLMGSGILVARYSIFYGKPSEYTDRKPEQAGYSLDIPKNVNAVKKLLSSSGFLEAIVSREERRIISSLDALNTNPNEAILMIPYLTEALKVK